MSRPDFYRAFEDRFRGPAQVVELRLSVYLPFVRAVADAHRGATLTDLGCGRGEWLALLQQAGIAAQGVDKDEAMLAACREQGLKVQCADAIEYLKGLPDASQLAISAFHFVEHVPFDALHVVASEAMRVLKPGGLLILETPNPESLVVSTTDFYNDPSHGQPIPPKLLAFLAEFHGFTDTKILRLQERRDLRELSPEGMSLWGVLTGTSPDYAVIARKSGPPATGDIAAFQQEYGVTLESLAIDFDIALRKWLAQAQEKLDAVHAFAASADASAKEAHRIFGALEADRGRVHEHLAAVDARFGSLDARLAALDSQIASAHAQQASTEAHLRAITQSRSWRMTAPLRWVAHKLRAIRNALSS
jgi:O-antigen chain-terminating methyltransferase